MIVEDRPYQTEAVHLSVDFLVCKKEKKNGLVVLPTGSGKSVVIAKICAALPKTDEIVVFQPSKEILQQNFQKFIQAGGRAGIYSASGGMKYHDRITFVTIGSVVNKKHLFAKVKHIIIDECHLVNPEDGMYLTFIESVPKAKVIGLTATPYRLYSTFEGSQLRFLTRTSPRVFNKLIYYVQTKLLFDNGYLAPLKYWSFNVVDRSQLDMNKKGTDFDEKSVRDYYKKVDMPSKIAEYANRILAKRRNLLTFCQLTDEAKKVAQLVPGSYIVTAETPDDERDDLLKRFKAGKIRHMVNVGVLTTGFDFPALEAVLIGRATMSLALYYQIIGRVMRFFKYPDGKIKLGWVIDLGGNYDLFGEVENLHIGYDSKELPCIRSKGRQLTNVTLTKN